jgi:hypothetical protein
MNGCKTFRDHRRLVVCVLIGCIAGDFARFQIGRRPLPPDISQVWFAAGAMLHGQNPYALVGPGLAFHWPAPLFYPLPSAIVVLPLAPLREATAVFLFVAVGAGVLAWALTAHRWGGLWAFASLGVHHALTIAQWSPLLAGAAVLAPVSAVLIAKPTVGMAVFAYRPSWWAVGGAIVATALAFVLQPAWVSAWREALHAASLGAGAKFPYLTPVRQPGGFLVLIALARWRRPEARLLVVLACVPHTMLPYETVLLFLVPRGWRQTAVLSALSWAPYWYSRSVLGDTVRLPDTVLVYAPAIVWWCYLPCVVMVLMRPNVGSVPVWIEARVASARRRATAGTPTEGGTN